MSGMVGVVGEPGQVFSRDALESMMAAQAHRGQDGCWSRQEGHLAMGFSLFQTTSCAAREALPWVCESPHLWLNGVIRIDNRDELRAHLGLSLVEVRDWPDSRWVLAAYKHWGERCVSYLLGAYAFAIWDGAKQALFCARDPMGVQPFYYWAGDVFLFASSIRAILAHPWVDCAIHEGRVLDYLLNSFQHVDWTFFRDVMRLPPGHAMWLYGGGQRRIWSYWDLEHVPDVRLSSSRAYVEQFRSIFEEAVRCRTRRVGPLGAFLSGGLDSSSVACLARDCVQKEGESLLTFSAVFPEVPFCDERAYIEAIVASGGMIPHWMRGDNQSPMRDWEEVGSELEEPDPVANMFLQRGLMKAAGEQGVRVLLCGVDGDTSVSHGFTWLTELGMMGDWSTFVEESLVLWEGFGTYYFPRPVDVFRRYGRPVLEELGRQGSWGRLWEAWRALPSTLSDPPAKWLRRYVLKPYWPGGWKLGRGRREDAMVSKRLREHAAYREVVQRRQAWLRASLTEKEQHLKALRSGLMPLGNELLDRVASRCGVELRYPFFDRRLIEFCVGLPPEEKWMRGWTRAILRRSMEGILPAHVQWRRDKSDLSPNVARTLQMFERPRLDRWILGEELRTPPFEEFVDFAIFQKRYRSFLYQPNDFDVTQLWFGLMLSLWLEKGVPKLLKRGV